jgi:hypothetical protein
VVQQGHLAAHVPAIPTGDPDTPRIISADIIAADIIGSPDRPAGRETAAGFDRAST